MEPDLQQLMDQAFEEVMGMKCRGELKYNSITKRHERQIGPYEIGDIGLDDLLEKSHSIYHGLLEEHRRCGDLEYKRRHKPPRYGNRSI
jgi:hypothetical protein